MIRFGLLALILAFALPAHAQLYKWVDSNGRVQYSDRPPAGGKKAEQISNANASSVGSQAPVAGAKEGARTPTDLEQDFRKRRAEQAEADKKQQQAAAEQRQKSETCDAARRNLAALQSGQRIARFNEKGERSYLEDAARAGEIERAQQQIQSHCN